MTREQRQFNFYMAGLMIDILLLVALMCIAVNTDNQLLLILAMLWIPITIPTLIFISIKIK